MMMGKYEYARCTKAFACPVCGRKKYCMVSVDGQFVVCTAVSENAVRSYRFGHLHRLTETVVVQKPPKVIKPSLDGINKLYQHLKREKGELNRLAESLSVSADSLLKLGAVHLEKDIWVFPMYNEKRVVVGLKCRSLIRKKWCVTGSRLGLYIPYDFTYSKPIIVCEGESDTAAGITAGLNMIGLPSATAGQDELVAFLNGKPAILVADNDKHGLGLTEMKKMAQRLHPSSRVILSPDYKDFREWCIAVKFKIPPAELFQKANLRLAR